MAVERERQESKQRNSVHNKRNKKIRTRAGSSRAAAKHTAKNANLEKTRASYYSGATADAELPFRISAKRAFHNGRPINGD
jgi:hypothetical protein